MFNPPRINARSRRDGATAFFAPLLAMAAAAFAIASVGRAEAAAVETTGSSPLAESVVRIGVTVSDADRSIEFFSKVLDFEKVSDDERYGPDVERLTGVFGARVRVARLRLGSEEIELTEYLTPRGKPVPQDSRSNDRWFQHVAVIVSDMDAAYARLRRHKVRHASTGPQRLPDWNKNAGGIRAFYFHDPDDHVLEILQFPPGKGQGRWQSKERLFLGIDHTAIVVADTDASLRFYRDRLGLRVVGGSENFGDEQEHLNNIFGARLRITTLRAAGGGPGVELLEYLTPRDGRPYPANSRGNDLFHWHTTVATPSAAAALQSLRPANSFISAGVTQGAFHLRDPDGHVVEVIAAAKRT
jgi:catechol 2,3-dioxygenase-like lactoylglutathione lyase family enzyme